MSVARVNPIYWSTEQIVSYGRDVIYELSRASAGTLNSYRLVLGRCLVAVDETELYKEFGCSGAAHYAVQILGIGRKEACELRRVARCLRALPKLSRAAEHGQIDWSKLREIVSKATDETEAVWLALARKLSTAKIQDLVVCTPYGKLPWEPLEEEKSVPVRTVFQLTPESRELFERAASSLSRKLDKPLSVSETLEHLVVEHLAKRPVDTKTVEKMRKEARLDARASRNGKSQLIKEAQKLAEELQLPSEDGDAEVSDLVAAIGGDHVLEADLLSFASMVDALNSAKAGELKNDGGDSPDGVRRAEAEKETCESTDLEAEKRTASDSTDFEAEKKTSSELTDLEASTRTVSELTELEAEKRTASELTEPGALTGRVSGLTQSEADRHRVEPGTADSNSRPAWDGDAAEMAGPDLENASGTRAANNATLNSARATSLLDEVDGYGNGHMNAGSAPLEDEAFGPTRDQEPYGREGVEEEGQRGKRSPRDRTGAPPQDSPQAGSLSDVHADPPKSDVLRPAWDEDAEDVAPSKGAKGVYRVASPGDNLLKQFEKEGWSWERLSFNPEARSTTPAQRAALLRRDGHCCATPGCANRHWLEVHHVDYYSKRG